MAHFRNVQIIRWAKNDLAEKILGMAPALCSIVAEDGESLEISLLQFSPSEREAALAQITSFLVNNAPSSVLILPLDSSEPKPNLPQQLKGFWVFAQKEKKEILLSYKPIPQRLVEQKAKEQSSADFS